MNFDGNILRIHAQTYGKIESRLPNVITVEAIDKHIAAEIEEVYGGSSYRHFTDPTDSISESKSAETDQRRIGSDLGLFAFQIARPSVTGVWIAIQSIADRELSSSILGFEGPTKYEENVELLFCCRTRKKAREDFSVGII